MITLFSLPAFITSLLGGLTCVGGVWILVFLNERRSQRRRALAAQQLKAREHLYEEFVNACAKLMREFMEDEMVAADTLASVIAIVNRIRVSASTPVLKSAEATLETITRDYLENDDLSMDEKVTHLRMNALRGRDPLSDFSRACRDELWELHATAG